MRRVDLSDLRHPSKFVLRDDDVSINDAHPVVPTENIKPLFHRCKLIERSASSVKSIAEMDMAVILLREVNRVMVLHRRNHHELAEELPIVRERQGEDVGVVDADGDTPGLDGCHRIDSSVRSLKKFFHGYKQMPVTSRPYSILQCGISTLSHRPA